MRGRPGLIPAWKLCLRIPRARSIGHHWLRACHGLHAPDLGHPPEQREKRGKRRVKSKQAARSGGGAAISRTGIGLKPSDNGISQAAERGDLAYGMKLWHAKKVQRIEGGQISLLDMVAAIEKLQRSAPIG